MEFEKRTFNIYWPKLDLQLREWLPSKGNVIFTLLIITILFWAQSVGAISLGASLAASTSTGTLAYQGRLANSSGQPLTQTVNMIFRLYAAASGGTPLWEEQWTGSNSVQVSDGLFNVMLGSLTPIPQAVITGNSNLFLGITVGTDSEMSPRVQLGSVPFATQALTVPDGSVTTTKLADGSVTKVKLGSDVNLTLADGSVTEQKLANHAVSLSKTTMLTFRSGYVDIPQTGNYTFVFTHNLGHTNYTAVCTAEDNNNRGRHLAGGMQANSANAIQFAVKNAGDDGTMSVRAQCVVIPD